jgi:hypothetical protein
LDEKLAIDVVHGGLSLRNLTEVNLGVVHGELYAKYLEGDLLVGQIQGNVQAREIQGACKFEEVNGNLDLREVEDNIQATVQGNARLRLSAMLGSDYQLQATGNVNCRIPADADLHLELASEAQIIKLQLPDGSETIKEPNYELTIGEGRARMQIKATGTIYLAGEGGWETTWEPADVEDFNELNMQIAQQIEAQILEQMETVTRQINEKMSDLSQRVGQAGLSPEETERIMEQARQVSEREAERLNRIQEKLERKLETAQRKRELHNKRRQSMKIHVGKHKPRVAWGSARSAVETPQEQVSEEERLTILRMLEQKKISLEEAEQLLAALEGK